MPNELERLLELACTERGYGPQCYRCLLESEVYAIRPAPGHRSEDGIVRFVMWTGEDGVQVIPYFSSRTLVRRALTPSTEAYKLTGRRLFEATRGATLVLNPNEPFHCRLAPHEITALLETGAVSDPISSEIKEEKTFTFDVAEHPPAALMHSLIVLYSQHPSVRKAHLVCFWPDDEPEKRAYLIGILLDASDGEAVARESAAVMLDVPPDMATDLLMFKTDEDGTLQVMEQLSAPFYERSLGARLIAPSSGTPM